MSFLLFMFPFLVAAMITTFLFVGVHSITELPYNECDEHTTSIVLPLSEIPELIKSLTALLDSE